MAPSMFAQIFTGCLKEGSFPAEWKIQKLVLIPKTGKPIGEPASYRPICLLNTIGKVLERVIYNRLYPLIDSDGYLSNRQFGFRKARSAVDATKLVFELARKAYDEGKYCALVTLDMKNALNSVRWNHIIEALIAAKTPKFILNIIFDYFRQRKLLYATDEGSKMYVITVGVPQGSVPGPPLWNLMYDGVLMVDTQAYPRHKYVDCAEPR